MLAFKTLNTDVSTEPDYLPLIAAAGMILLEADYIAQSNLDSHLSVSG